MIRFDNVTKIYPRAAPGAAALHDVSFRIAKGEFVFLTGPSGAGKSTILKLLYMDERPTNGEVRVSGYNSYDIKQRDVPKLRRRLGIVFQDFRLLEDRTAEAERGLCARGHRDAAGEHPRQGRARADAGRARVQVHGPSPGAVRRRAAARRVRPRARERPVRARSPTNRPETSTSAQRAASSSSFARSTRPAPPCSWRRTTSSSFAAPSSAPSSSITARSCSTRPTSPQYRSGGRLMTAFRTAIDRLQPRAAAQRAERHDDRLFAVCVRSVRPRRAQHQERAACASRSASRFAPSSPTRRRSRQHHRGVGRDREVSGGRSKSTSSRRSRRSSARGRSSANSRTSSSRSSCRRRST